MASDREALLSRRAFLKGGSALALTTLAGSQLPALSRQRAAAADDLPNILVIVFDTLSAPHMSLYGYNRHTTPNLERFAERATVFHRHYAAGNFTTVGTASLLTGTYPWTHRAFNHMGTLDSRFHDRNLFAALPAAYHRAAYSHNFLADALLAACGRHIDEHLSPLSFSVYAGEVSPVLFPRDADIAYRSFDDLLLRRGEPAGSLFLSLADRLRLTLGWRLNQRDIRGDYPRGVPGLFKLSFVLEDVLDGVAATIDRLPQPFLGYFHLLPPHEPYRPHKDFIGRFEDGWNPPVKPENFLSEGVPQDELNRFTREYDEFLAYADDRFGRLLDFLERTGRLDDTIVVFTSDHGQLFERGIHGHVTPALYEQVIHVPLLISLPGQQQRYDVYWPTSCVDLVPTLLAAAGQSQSDWPEGDVLPLAQPQSTEAGERVIYAVEAKTNPKQAPLNVATITAIGAEYKLHRYSGYLGQTHERELYDISGDPDELVDLAESRRPLADELEQTLTLQLQRAEQVALG